MSLEIRRLSYALGAEIIGIDIRELIDDKSFSEVYTAFLEYGILLFRGQSLTQEQHLTFSRRFGKIDGDQRENAHPKFREIFLNKPKPNSEPEDLASQFRRISLLGEYWHSDRAHTLIPAKVSLLRAIEIPEVGGDTMFSNTYLAYETLSDRMKKLIEGQHVIHLGRVNQTDGSSAKVAQPLVRVHPETGRKVLFLTEQVQQFVGMTVEESAPLIQFLCGHATRPQFVYRHQWRKDDLIIWDNRCTMHNALGDYDKSQVRHMERVTVMGTPSGYAYTA